MSSLFGQGAANSGGSLFGSLPQGTNNTSNTNNLFGNTNTQNSQQQPPQQNQSSNLFSNTAPGSSLFSNTNTQPQHQTTQNTNSGLFGSTTTQQQPPQNPFQPPGALPQSDRSWAERTLNNPQTQSISSVLQSGLGSNSTYGAIGTASQLEMARARLQSVGVHATTNEKTTKSQIETLMRKWDPNSTDTLMQTYLYNGVTSAFAPFYHKNADESEREWEEALAKKPAPVENPDGSTVSFVPVLVRGFRALGDRVEYQAKIVNEMRARLHEMNNSLDAVMAKHQQELAVRLEKARKMHTMLAQRTLRLAVKAQTLRGRGYQLDAAEEGLRKTLLELQNQVLDPAFAGREEEIWARLVSLRERARWLEEEGKRLGNQADEQNAQGGSGLSEEVVLKTKKILRDYDGQLVHLAKELEEVGKEYKEWEERRRTGGRR